VVKPGAASQLCECSGFILKFVMLNIFLFAWAQNLTHRDLLVAEEANQRV
jgi:hypothetical protein